MAELSDKAREEFFSEAQEIIETLSRNLLSLDQSIKAGTSDPSLINEAFRAVHTLKGLAGLFGAVRLGALSHRLEDVLDDLRVPARLSDPVRRFAPADRGPVRRRRRKLWREDEVGREEGRAAAAYLGRLKSEIVEHGAATVRLRERVRRISLIGRLGVRLARMIAGPPAR